MQRTNYLASRSTIKFQSMHPIKDATDAFVKPVNVSAISIHAPYKGCNLHNNGDVLTLENFNPCTL